MNQSEAAEIANRLLTEHGLELTGLLSNDVHRRDGLRLFIKGWHIGITDKRGFVRLYFGKADDVESFERLMRNCIKDIEALS